MVLRAGVEDFAHGEAGFWLRPLGSVRSWRDRDPQLILAMEKLSWFTLGDHAEMAAPEIPDMHLSDEATSFYPRMMAHLRQHEPAAFKAQQEWDAYGFLAKLTVVPGGGVLPVSGGGLMLLPVWSQQLSGTSLIISVRSEEHKLKKLFTRVSENYQRCLAKNAGAAPPAGSICHVIHHLATSSPQYKQEAEELHAVSQLLWRSGVRHSCMRGSLLVRVCLGLIVLWFALRACVLTVCHSSGE